MRLPRPGQAPYSSMFELINPIDAELSAQIARAEQFDDITLIAERRAGNFSRKI
jgi:hypothetical protein